MRKVKITKPPELPYIALFVQYMQITRTDSWGTPYQMPSAIVEKSDGTVEAVPISYLNFNINSSCDMFRTEVKQ